MLLVVVLLPLGHLGVEALPVVLFGVDVVVAGGVYLCLEVAAEDAVDGGVCLRLCALGLGGAAAASAAEEVESPSSSSEDWSDGASSSEGPLSLSSSSMAMAGKERVMAGCMEAGSTLFEGSAELEAGSEIFEEALVLVGQVGGDHELVGSAGGIVATSHDKGVYVVKEFGAGAL